MVSIRFTSFLLGILLFSIAVRDSIADSHDALEKAPAAGENRPPTRGRVLVTLNKEIFGYGVPAAEVKNTRTIGGRKMMLKRDLGKETVEAHFVGNFNHKGKGMLNAEGKFSNRSVHPAVKVKMGGFIAFNADYHVPKPHPPKNN